MGSGPGGGLYFSVGEVVERRVPGGERLHCASLFLYTLSLVPLLLLQFLCVVPVNCLYLNPRGSRVFFFSLLRLLSIPPEGGGRSERAAVWSFVTSWAETTTVLFGAQRGARGLR